MTTPNTQPTAPDHFTAEPALASPARSSFFALPVLKRSVIKRHALACSKTLRRGKFKRVGLSFCDEVQAEFDAVLRQFALAPLDGIPAPELPPGILSRDLRKKVVAAAELAAARLIERKVRRHPECGKTLLAIRS